MTAIASAKREPLLDNLKFVLITFVVFAHFIEPYIDQSVTIRGLFVGIYFFHIPFFVFISGYFSKSASSQSIDSNIRNLLIPYLVFSSLWYLKDDLHAKELSLNIVVPPFHFWYFLSLFCWRLTLQVIQRFRYYLPLSIIVALLIGLSPNIGQTLSLSRTITLFPFFILGTLCTEELLRDLHKKKSWIPLGITAWFAMDYLIIKLFPQTFEMVFWDEPYLKAAGSKLTGLAGRSLLFVTAIVSSLAILTLTPGKKLFITKIGAKTLPIYAFHAFLVPRFARIFPLWNDNIYTDAFILIFPFILVGILSLPVFDTIYRYMTGALQPLVRKSAST